MYFKILEKMNLV
jgi:hypothetical protein